MHILFFSYYFPPEGNATASAVIGIEQVTDVETMIQRAKLSIGSIK